MTLRASGRPNQLTLLWRRWRNAARTMFARGDAFTLIVACLIMVIPVLAFSNALNIVDDAPTSWRVSLNQLIPVAILSVIFGFLLARSHYSEMLALLLSSVYAIGTIVAVQFLSAPGDPITRVREIAFRFAHAISVGLNTEIGLDPYLLILFLSILVWFLGHNTAWHIFRMDRVWRAILPPAIVLVLNSFYNIQSNSLDFYLIIFMFLTLLLIIRSHVEAREFDWYANRVSFRGNLRDWFFRVGSIIAVIVICIAWLLPTGNPDDNAKRFQDFLNSGSIERAMEVLNKLFSSLDSQSVATADYFGGDTLRLGGAIQLGGKPVMAVSVPPTDTADGVARYYWKSRIFDTYSNGEWTAPRAETLDVGAGGLVLDYSFEDSPGRAEIPQFVSVLASTKLLYAAPQVTQLRMPVRVEMDRLGSGVVDPSVVRPLTPLRTGDQYEVTSSVVVATAAMLRAAGTDYPAWVKVHNLQRPPEVTQRVIDLAFQIVAEANAQTPYDKARAIEQWLRNNIAYDETPPQAPPGRDLIDFTLFESRQGYCTYYASAMVMMMRALGIPARMAAGFAQGEYQSAQQVYLVLERDAHTWVEVYFPGVGWVEFEPTKAQTELNRSDPQVVQPTPTNTPTPLPTATPTIPPTPTNNAVNAAQPTPTALQPTSELTFTPTAQVSPTPTSSPTPTPPSQPPSFLELPPPVRNTFSLLLVLAAIVALISFALVTGLWWVEYRGLDRLSPIGRAYARLAIYAKWLGITVNKAQTPLERGRRIARDVPTSANPVLKITDNYIVERYAPPSTVRPDDEQQTKTAWHNARRAFLRTRLRAMLPKWLRRNKEN
ncbi:MAG: hypothetical protein KF726_15920 [Anaerolineae bacterium]|nr:hypothetical protein [Anaerolineae bacterium]